MKLRKVISGGQTGADQAGLVAAKEFGLETGGWMPFGYLTEDGPCPELKQKFGVQAHSSSSYPPRTKKNAEESDGTIRLAFDFTTAGEVCTLKAIKQYKKPYFDVDLNNPPDPQLAAQWLIENNIEVLNVAGNRQKTNLTMHDSVVEYLRSVFSTYRKLHNADSAISGLAD